MAAANTTVSDEYLHRLAKEEEEEEYTELAPPRKSQWERVMRSQSLTIALQVLGALAAAGAGTARPLMAILFGNLVNLYNGKNGDAGRERLKHEINSKVLQLLYVFIGQWFLVCAYGILFSIAAMRYTMRMRALYLKAAVSQDIEWVSQSSAATDLSTNASIIEDALAEKLGTILQAASTVVTAMVISFYWSWRLSLGLVFVIVVLILKDVITATIDAKLERRVQAVETDATTLAEECISGIRTVTACRATSKFASRYANILEKSKKIAFLKSPVVASQYAITYFAVLSAYALAFWYGTRLLRKGQIESGGAICIVLISLNTGMNALRLLLPLYGVVAKARAAHSSLKSVMDTQARLDPFSKAGIPLDALYSRIGFHNVDFVYPSRPSVKVLKNLSLEFGAGKTTAVIGPSGCGKSSLVALLERFYSPLSGSIQINGTDIGNYNLKSLRSNVRVVQQDVVLFNDTIFNNIAHGLIGSPYNALSEREKRRLVTKVCKDMQAHDFISELPDGYDTIVGNRGNLLSGGQRQRVAIARAIISNPVILIFDEATSALDNDSERLVQAAIDRVSRGRTTVIIAHKLATVKRADRIVLMKDGTITEEGTHESLLRTSDAYVKSWMAQNLAEEEHWRENKRSSNSSLTSNSVESSPEKVNRYSENDVQSPQQDDGIIVDMAQDDPMSFVQSIRYIVSGSRALQYISGMTLLVCIITGGVYPTQAIIFGNDVVSFQKSPEDMVRSINFWSLMFFVLAVVSLFSFFALGSLSSVSGTITSHLYREKYFRALITQPMSFFERTTHTPGFLMTSLSSHPTHLQGFVVLLSSLTVTTVNLSSVAVLGLIVSWRFALVAIFGAVPIISIAGFLRIQSQSRKSKSLSDPLIDSAQYAAEVIGNIRTVSAFAMEAEVCSTMARKMNLSLRPFYRSILVTMPLFAFSHSGNLLGVTFSFWYAGTLLTQHKIGALELWIIYFGIVTGAEATSEFFASANSIVHARSSCGRIFSIISASAKEQLPPNAQESEKPVSSSITFDHVSFSYPNVSDAPVLHDVCFHVQQGQHIAIVGPSGSGKSTIISLLERFYRPSNGQLRVGGVPLADTDVDTYRDHVSLVSQDTQLFQGTVRDNILLGVPMGEESEETMIKAAREAHIHDFIMSLPEGYDTPCGRKGASFSGGQCQRLAIARALVRNPSLLLLDEATSALDTESEGEVKMALKDASAGRTTIAVAHRLSTIRDADCIHVLVKGRIVESGTHDELTRDKGVYWGMCFGLISLVSAQAGYVWPSKHDAIEDLLFIQSGYIRFGSLSDQIQTCAFGANQPGIQKTAEWVRTAFHDSITHDAAAKTGGLDASIMFELDRVENLGAALNSTLSDISSDLSVRSSAADLLALALVMSVDRCGDLKVPLRLGRIDATEAGPLGVPEAHTDLNTTMKTFEKAGFNQEEMITLVACGHTLGSVHSVDHPEIVAGEQTAANIATFDTTASRFDPVVVTEYLADNTTNPLIINQNDTLNSDKRIFAADGNVTMTKLASPTVYKAQCEALFERMIDLVPSNVTLTDPLQPIDVKPYIASHQLLNSSAISFVGRIRIRTTTTPPIDPSSISVSLSYLDRDGVRSNTSIPTTMATLKGGTSFGYGEDFSWYEFNQVLPASTGISAFDVVMTSKTNGTVTRFDNTGTGGYKVSPYILFQQRNSCLHSEKVDGVYQGTLSIVAAVHQSRLQLSETPQLKLVHKVPLPRSFMSRLDVESVALEETEGAGGEFVFYKVQTPLEVASYGTTFDVEIGEEKVEFQNMRLLQGATCAALV
ncbi:hypothetical protein K504DRAFT_497197 [Pleomassaria siparia CBS 279.74]|uniref:Peroxidase n=1 Tax=Pleomassaria siparia CBS 279.74 TaxID=1314801 RepID=A0A6G1KRZ5_9PLEO|nr:hypothetical protein K504DRAFT_497197 [Pleomassaria siparia CBS 279.74]